MYLSSLELNLQSRRVQKELADRYELHRTLMHAFKPQKPEDERLLFRLEIDHGSAHVLVQTQNIPAWSFLSRDEAFHGYLLDSEPQVKAFAPHLKPGQRLYFRLLANPASRKAIYKDKKGHGKRIGIYEEELQKRWLAQKGQLSGFRPLDMYLKTAGLIHGVQSHEDENHTLKIFSVQYDGLLEVTDVAAFERTLCAGIGPAKGFGCGLLSLARA